MRRSAGDNRYHRVAPSVLRCNSLFFIAANAMRMRARKIDRKRAMCPSCVLINHATRDSSVRDELRPSRVVSCGWHGGSSHRKPVPLRDTVEEGEGA